MKLEDIRLGDLVRLRNGETIAVGTKCVSYGDASGEHEGPFIGDRAFRSKFLVADVVEVVLSNPRRCVFCGEGVTARTPETDFCVDCFHSGRWWEESRADLFARLRTVDGVRDATVWHTGGGCFLLAVTLDDGRLVTTTDGNGGLPEDGEYWRDLVVSESEEAFDEWEEERMQVHEGEWNDEDLVATIEAEIARAG